MNYDGVMRLQIILNYNAPSNYEFMNCDGLMSLRIIMNYEL